jgi:NitT/TauT family transport system ATP-binding protein
VSAPDVRIVVDSVRKSFRTSRGDELPVIRDVSLSIRDGEFVSIIGPSGCGKTTLLNILAGFEKQDSGSVSLDGKPITGPDAQRGVIFQEYGVFPWLTVRQNIGFGLRLRSAPKKEIDETVAHYIALMGLRGFEDAFPKTLSGGMKQRVALARAYAVKSQFLLMDEPFGALDAQTRSAMHDVLLHALEKEGKTVLLITHSVEEALYLSSRILVTTARPAHIRRAVDVPFPYPRRSGLHRQPEFAALQHEIHELVMQQYARQQRLQGAHD